MIIKKKKTIQGLTSLYWPSEIYIKWLFYRSMHLCYYHQMYTTCVFHLGLNLFQGRRNSKNTCWLLTSWLPPHLSRVIVWGGRSGWEAKLDLLLQYAILWATLGEGFTTEYGAQEHLEVVSHLDSCCHYFSVLSLQYSDACFFFI
jgi:hypothetical protein